jgi:hypothetical protein
MSAPECALCQNASSGRVDPMVTREPSYRGGEEVATMRLDAAKLVEPTGEGGGVRKVGEIAEEGEFAGRKGGMQLVEEEPPEEPREDAYRQKEPRATGDPARVVERRPAAGHNAMSVRMMVQVAPGVEHRDEAVNGGVIFLSLGEVIFPRRATAAIKRAQAGRIDAWVGGRGGVAG